MTTDRPATRLATRLAFLVAGFGIASWAPMVPLAKQRLAVDDGTLGLLLLCIGIGSVTAMMVTGALAGRHGSKPFIVAGGLGLAAFLPTLSVASTPFSLGFLLLLFGASLGTIDVAMNVHAVDVERGSPKPLMSGFHALFSIGGFAGAGLMTLMLSRHLPVLFGSLICATLMLMAMIVAWPRFLVTHVDHDAPLFVRPRGIVLLLASLTAVVFLVEGAMLDWSALLIIAKQLLSRTESGVGYFLFAIAMTVGRLGGDRVTARLGDSSTLLGGGLVAMLGLAVLLCVSTASIALGGFLLIGLGLSNIVPVLFRQAGAQTSMPSSLAVAAITTTGYSGVLLGPAFIGFVAKGIGLANAFWLLVGMLCLVPATARALSGRSRFEPRRIASHGT